MDDMTVALVAIPVVVIGVALLIAWMDSRHCIL